MRASLRRLAVAPFEAGTALPAVIIGLRGTVTPAWAGTVEAAVPSLARAWSVSYALAGMLILIGLATGRRAVEVIGLAMLSAGVTVQAVSVINVAGWQRGSWPTLARMAFAAAALVRAHTVITGRDIVEVDVRSLQ